MMRKPRVLALTFLLGALVSLPISAARAESAATTVQRVDAFASFTRYERAWAAYQLKVTSRQYDIGDPVTAAARPSSEASLFTAYRLLPVQSGNRTMQTMDEPVNSDGSRVRLCLSTTLRSAAELDGFLQGVRQAGAALATGGCLPGTLSNGFSYPVQLHAFKVVRALRAVSIIERDQAERAAQLAVADTISFSLPEGKLLDMAAQPGGSSGDYGVVLHNNSPFSWTLGSVTVAAPFSASAAGCVDVFPGMSCMLTVSFSPVSTGRFMDFVTMTPVDGKTLSIRVAGTGVATP